MLRISVSLRGKHKLGKVVYKVERFWHKKTTPPSGHREGWYYLERKTNPLLVSYPVLGTNKHSLGLYLGSDLEEFMTI